MVKRSQSGVALVVVLVLMLALTGLGLMSAKLALGGETLARNQLDHEVAFQAAEAALRDAEKDILLASYAKPAAARCSRGYLPTEAFPTDDVSADCRLGRCVFDPDKEGQWDYSAGSSSKEGSGAPWWPNDKGGKWNNSTEKATSCDFNGAVPLGTFTGSTSLEAVARQPEYLLENFKRSGKLIFRITARGFGYRQNSEVVLQSYFVYPE